MDKDITVVGIQGMMGAGKSTVRDVLVEEFGAVCVPMSDPIKWMLQALGASDEQLYGDLKAEPCDAVLCGKTPRHALQTLGTEWGRDLIGPGIWVDAVRSRIRELHEDLGSTLFIVDDVRFPNEAEMVRSFKDGYLWTVRRPEVEYSLKTQDDLRAYHATGQDIMATSFPVHESERWWPVAPYDVKVVNTGTVEQLVSTVRCIAKGITADG